MAEFIVKEAGASGVNAAQMAALTRACFPWSPRWSPLATYATLYWRSALPAAAARTVVADDQRGGLGGFVLLVLDERAFGREMERARRGPVDLCGIAAYAPLARLLEWRQRRAAPRWDPSKLQAADPPRPRAWIELIGVRPSCRGHGLGQRMLALADDLAREHGARAIEALTARWNAPALAMFERAGYRAIHATPRHVVSSKSL